MLVNGLASGKSSVLNLMPLITDTDSYAAPLTAMPFALPVLSRAAEAQDSFSKEDMLANGLASGRSSFYDMVHPTASREATEQAHTAIGSSSSTMPAAAVPAAAAAAAAGGGGVTQPMAITGVSVRGIQGSKEKFVATCSEG
jgi:hypothetical protein